MNLILFKKKKIEEVDALQGVKTSEIAKEFEIPVNDLLVNIGTFVNEKFPLKVKIKNHKWLIDELDEAFFNKIKKYIKKNNPVLIFRNYRAPTPAFIGFAIE